ncbi:MAG: DUF2178 domain-containing protein [Tissierellaceae bacterium]|nr:DUF2178 domain-containing protein [Tissierellaceae bacterium]
MEDKLKWNRLKEFGFGLIGYLLGTIIHALLGYSGYTSRVLFGVTFVVIMRALYDLYRNLRYPKIIEKEKQLEKDERNLFIKYKSAHIAINVSTFTLAIVWIITIIIENRSMSYFVSGSLLYIIAVRELSRYYINKKI